MAALTILAVTSAFKANQNFETFYYHGYTFDQASIELESNWSTLFPSSSEQPIDCGLNSEVTCYIVIPEGYKNPANNRMDGSKAIIIANPQSNPSDPTTVDDVQSTTFGNPSLSMYQVKGALP